MEVVVSLTQGRTAAAQCGLFTHKSVPVIFEPPCTLLSVNVDISIYKFITNYRLQYVLKYLLKVSIKLNGGVVV